VIALLVTLVAVVRDDDGGTGVTATPGGVAPSQIVAATEDGRLVVLDAATGAEIRTLADGLDAGTTVAVTPDGERVFFDRPNSPESDPPRELLTVPTGGGEPDRLIGGAGQPAVSPDGRLLAFVRYQPPGLQVVEIPDTFEGWIPNVVGDGEVSGTSQAVLAPSWAPDSRHLVYTVAGTPEGSPPRVAELGYGMRLDAAPPILVSGCAVTSYIGDSGLVAVVQGGDRAIAVDPASGQEVRELFRGPGLLCGNDRPLASDKSGAHVLYVTSEAAPALFRWSDGEAGPTKIADGIVAAAWLAPPT
jgi:Tol biopolymer transport system component